MRAAAPRSLAEWLAFQESLHPLAIDLGLERVRTVLERMGLRAPPYPVLAVGGTNGKGSCVACLDAMLGAAGYRVGAYVSPHLERYNERVRVAGREATDPELCAAFARVEAARRDLTLTYFEFGTCAALEVFRARGVEVAVLEVGLGGRLDAVNAVEPLASAVTSVALDHEALLGGDREAIGREKAGIFRAARPAVCGDAAPPASLVAQAAALGAPLWIREREFGARRRGAGWECWHPHGVERDLPPPALAGEFQYHNAATALALLASVRERLPVPREALAAGLAAARNPGRLERVAGPVEHLLDVAHNPHAAAALAAHLAATRGAGRTLAVIGMYADKDAAGLARALGGAIDAWFAGDLAGPRGRTGAELAAALGAGGAQAITAHADVLAAHDAALAAARAGDRIVVLGSFATVGAVRARGVYSAPSRRAGG